MKKDNTVLGEETRHSESFSARKRYTFAVARTGEVRKEATFEEVRTIWG